MSRDAKRPSGRGGKEPGAGLAGPVRLPSGRPPKKAGVARLSDAGGTSFAGPRQGALAGCGVVRGQSCRIHEAGDVFRRDLDPERVSEGVNAKQAKVVVEVTQVRRQGDSLDACISGALGQAGHCTVTGWIVVTDDIEASEGRRELDGGKMGGG